MKIIFASTKIAITLLVVLVLSICSQSPLAYGVVLWEKEGNFTNGMIVEVIEESDVENRYMVRGDSVHRDTQLLAMPQWQLQAFSELNEANDFTDSYRPFYDSYAYVDRSGLPVRKTPSSTADIVYKLRDGELVKVIDRSKTQQKVGVFENYWFQIITNDGTKGYTFGEFLVLFESIEDPHAEAARLHSEDPILDHLLGTVWWPDYYLSMIRQGRYDLNRFKEEYGLFPDPKENVFRLVTDEFTYEFVYDSIERIGDNRYKLNSSDTAQSVRFVVQAATRLVVSFLEKGQQISKVFVGNDWDIGQLISSEKERRNLILKELIDRTRLLSSNQYGTINLSENGYFRWEGVQALEPIFVPKNLPGSGQVEFRYALGASLLSRYDEVVTFIFDDPMDLVTLPEVQVEGVTVNTLISDLVNSINKPSFALDNQSSKLQSADVISTSSSETDSVAQDQITILKESADINTIEMRPEIELNLLVTYTERGLRMTPAVADPESLEVNDDNLSPVVMFFSYVDERVAESSD